MFTFSSKTDNKIFWLLKLLLAAPLLLPLFVSASFLFPYTGIKAFLFRIIVEIAAFLYLYLALPRFAWSREARKYRQFIPPFFKGGRARAKLSFGGILNYAILAFLAVFFISALFGLDFSHSFWGDLERMNGIWGLLHFVAWFFMLVFIPPFVKGDKGGFRIFQEQNYFFRLLQLSVAVSSLVALLAVFQKFTSLGLLLPQVNRVYSTIGNPAFLGTYLLFNIFFAGYLAIISKGKTKWLFAIGDFLLAISLLLTGTRGAFLGLAAGMVVFLILLAIIPLFKGGAGGFKKLPIAILAAIILFSATLFFFRDTSFIKSNSVLFRSASIFSLGGATAQSRLILWGDAWRVWQDRPMLGYGQENFESAVNPYLSPRLADYESFAFDRAHNFIFDYGVAGGFLGLLAYLAVLAAAGWSLLPERIRRQAEESKADNKTLRQAQGMKKDFYFSAVFLSLLAAYLIQNFFVFDTFISYLMLFFMLVLVSGMSLRGGASLIGDAPTRQSRLNTPQSEFVFYKKAILFIFVIFIFFSLYSFNLKPLRASYLANQILSTPAETLAAIAPANMEKILALNTFASPEIIYQITLDYLSKINQAPQLTQDENFYKLAAGALSANIGRSPAQAKNYIVLAWLNLYFSGADSQRTIAAIDLGLRAKDLSPAKKDVYLVLAAGYTLSGQTAKAAEIVAAAKAMNPKIGAEVEEYWGKIK